MRKFIVPIVLGSAMALGACATNPYGSQYGSPYGAYGGTGGPLEAVLGAVIGSSGNSGYYGNQGYGYGSSFQQAAINACGSAAARYGQVQIRDVRASSNSTLRVYGVVGSSYGARNFGCSFRSDGRITDFDI